MVSGKSKNLIYKKYKNIILNKAMEQDICKSREISGLLQSFIYAANDPKDRNTIINYYINLTNSSKTHQWLGTWHLEYSGKPLTQNQLSQSKQQQSKRKCLQHLIKVSESVPELSGFSDKINEFVEKNKNSIQRKISLFTVCVTYEGNSVHFVSYIYYPSEGKLISFDPGVEVYHHGQKTIVPCIRQAFHKCGLISNAQSNQNVDLGRCTDFEFCGKIYGVQFNGTNQDAFCQSWTLFFLIRSLFTTHNDHSFVSNWCKISPVQREFLIIIYFIIPSLSHFEEFRLKYLDIVKNHVGEMNLVEVLDKIYDYATKCHLASCKTPNSQKISCQRQKKTKNIDLQQILKIISG
jgi:hypothetical protein